MLRQLLAFSALVIFTVTFLYAVFTDVSKRSLLDQAQKNFSTILTMAEDQLNQKMSVLSEQTLRIMVDPSLYGQMVTLDKEKYVFYNLIRSDVNNFLSACFYRFPDVISAQILYQDYSFAYRVIGRTNYQSIQQSKAWQKIQDANGSIVWFPPDMDQYFGESGDERGNIWFGRALNITDLLHYKRISYKSGDKPVLVICLKSGAFSEPLLNSIGAKGARYLLLDEDGKPFDQAGMSGDSGLAALSDEIARHSAQGSSGVYDDGSTLYCYVRSQTTGWYHIVCVGRETIIGSMLQEIGAYILRTSVLLMAAMLLIAALFSRAFSGPIKKLIAAVNQIEQGEFGQQIEYRRSNEMGYLISHFNEMSRSIQRLIQENYQVKLREKDTEIMSLTTQFNPHYLYNTLNAIYWTAVRGDAKEAANMIRSLSQMMRYTSDQKQERTLLREDIEWLKRYLYLMEARYGELFRTEWQIDPGLEEMLVPKLFLQPLVENCILHGFKDMETGGLITIRGYEAEDALMFVVRDNGCGMTQAQLDALLDGKDQASIGLANVQRRIQLICGAEYGLHATSSVGHGSTVTVRVSKESTMK